MMQTSLTPDTAKSVSPSPAAISVFLALVVIAFYGVTLRWGLINYDDPDYILENPNVISGLSVENIIWAFTHVRSANWHPLTWISLQLDVTLFGTWYGGFHLTNLLLHACSAVMVFWIFFQGTGAKWRSTMVALIFAIHPNHLESVAWVTERKDTLSGALGLLALLAYLSFAKKGGAGRLALVCVLLAVGLLAKQMLVTWPCVMLLMDGWPLGRVQWPGRWTPEPALGAQSPFRRAPLRSLLLEKLPMFVIVAAASVATVIAQREATNDLIQLSISDRIINFFVSIARYLARTFVPTDTAVLYPFSKWAAWQIAGAVAMFFAISAWVWTQRKPRPFLLFGWLWFVGTLVPVIGLVQVGQQALANRYLYLPHVGLFAAVVWGVADLPALRRNARAAAAVAVVVTALLCVQFFRLLPVWSDSALLWEHTIQHTKANCVAHYQLASEYAARKRYDLAIPQLYAALAIRPQHTQSLTNLGMAYIALKRPGEAIAPLLEVKAIKPDHYPARANLASALAESGRHNEAVVEFREVLRMDPKQTSVWIKLAEELDASGDLAGAERELRALLALHPDNAVAHNALGIALAKQNNLSGAAEQFTAALRIDPAMSDARENLARAQRLLQPQK